MMAMLVVSVLGTALLLASSSEMMMAANFQRAIEAQYAAEAAVERAVSDALAATDWTGLLNGLASSSFVDGPPAGSRPLGDGSRLDLDVAVNLANCGRPAACMESDLVSVRAGRPWGRNNPRWRLYGHGRFDLLTGAREATPPFYLVIMVADDPLENDDQPLVDGGPPVAGETDNAGRDVLVLRGEAYGPRGSYARVDATLVRGRGVVSWRLVR
jgi:hypothetical protein